MLNGGQDTARGDGGDSSKCAALRRCSKRRLIYRGQCASEQFIKKEKEKGKKKKKRRQPRKLIKEMEMPTIAGSSKCQPAPNQVTRSNLHN